MPGAIPEPNQSIGATGSIRGLIVSKSNEQLNKERADAIEAQHEEPLPDLVVWVRRAFEAAKAARDFKVQLNLERSLRQREGVYDPDKVTNIAAQGGSDVYMQLTGIKCVAAESWIRDIIQPADDKPWAAKPTPMPDLPPDVQAAVFDQVSSEIAQLAQQGVEVTPAMAKERAEQLTDGVDKELQKMARKAAARMEKKIDDQFVEGNFYEALNEAIYDVVTFPIGVIRQCTRRRAKLKWDMTGDQVRPIVDHKVQQEWYRVSPFDCYPAPDSTDVNDGYFIERHQLRRDELISMKGVPGFSSEAIDLVLSDYGASGLKVWLAHDQQRADLEDRDSERFTPDRAIEALEYWGMIQGRLLLEWGISEKQVKDPWAEYQANVWVIGKYAIKATLNKDPLGRRPYFIASFEEQPGSFWGRGVPEKMRDIQIVCNAVARALVNNVAIASGPQVEVFEDRMMPGEDITSLYPWKIWQTKADPTGGGHKAINFDQPTLVSQHLMRIYEFFNRLADDHTGIPAYAYGNANVGGGGRTAAGLSMLMSAASKGIKQVIGNMDKGLIEPAVERQYQFNMQFDPDRAIKGDIQVQARGSIALIAKEQVQIRRTEFLNATANPFDMQIIGARGRAALLREIVKALDMPPSDIIPTEDQIEQQMQAMQDQPALPAPGGEASQQPGPQATNMAGDGVKDFNVV